MKYAPYVTKQRPFVASRRRDAVASKKKPSYSIKKPTAPQEQALKAFVEKGKADAAVKTTRRQRKTDDRPMARLTVWLPEDALKAVKRAAIEHDTTVQEILADLVGEWQRKAKAS
jgi:DNA-binding GntR family transcriptional regulator